MHASSRAMAVSAARCTRLLHRPLFGQHPLAVQEPPQQQQRKMSSSGAQRLTVQQKRKVSRALVRARRLRDQSMAKVLGDDWEGYEGPMRQGLRELDGKAEVKGRGTYASKPLVSFKDDVDDEIDDRRASQHEAWADQVEDIWNEILIADSRAGRPRVTLPGFPIEVLKVKIARDYGHHRIFWDFTQEIRTRPPAALLRQLHEARSNGFSTKAVVLKSTEERLTKYEGFLRANLARRIPLRRVPEIRWQHISEMPMSLQLELA